MPPVRLRRAAGNRASAANLAEAASSSSSSSALAPPSSLSRRSSGRAAAARIASQSQLQLQYQQEQEEQEGEDDQDAEDESGLPANGAEDEELTELPSSAMASDQEDSYVSSVRKGKGRASGGPARPRGRPPGSGRPRGRPPKQPKLEVDEMDVDDDDSFVVKQESGASTPRTSGRPRGRPPRSSLQSPASPSKRGSVILSRGRPSAGRRRSALIQPDSAEEDDEDEQNEEEEEQRDDEQEQGQEEEADEGEEELAPMKKRPSRTNGFRLVFDNAQTSLIRRSKEEAAEIASGRVKGRRKGRKPRSGNSTRIIEDSEDEQTDDDRPRPPNPVEEEIDDEIAVPPSETFKCKISGKVEQLECDEVLMDVDEDGEKKIDANGVLQGDRSWKAPSFTSTYRSNPRKVYFLSVDAARACGYRDSLTFFRSDLRLIKLSLIQAEKDDLIAAGRLNGQLRGRNVTMVTARSVYKVYGAKVIKNGRAVVDDYYESAARVRLEEAGKADAFGKVLPDEDLRTAAERRRDADRERDRSRRPPDAVSTTIFDATGNAFTTTYGDNGASPFVRSINHTSRRLQQQRADLTEENWMLEMSKMVRGLNDELTENRRERVMKFHLVESDAAPVKAAATAPEDDGNATVSIDAEGGRSNGAVELLVNGADDSVENMDVDGITAAEPLDSTNRPLPSHSPAPSHSSQLARAERYKDLYDPSAPPIGLYDPTTNLPHYSASTQPTSAKMVHAGIRPNLPLSSALPPSTSSSHQRPVLLGPKVGSGALGVATFSTELDWQSKGLRDWQGELQRGRKIPAGSGGGAE